MGDNTPYGNPGAAAPDPMIGRMLARNYRIVEKLGEGGMGAVYKAEHTKMGRTCAIKLLHAMSGDKAAALARFEREARMSSKIDNPHAVTIYDFGEAEDGSLYLAMEFIRGRSLGKVLAQERTLPIHRVVHITRQIAEGLAAAHVLDIVHRDLKPDNVMLTEKGGEAEYVKVLDFGIAKSMRDDNLENITQTGYVLGTPVYMSPEQLSGEKLDGRSDTYSLAIMVYEMLSGRLPFEGDNPQAIMIKRVMTEPIPLRHFAPQIGDGIERAVMSGLARRREERPPTAIQFAEALAGAANMGTRAIGGRPTNVLENEGAGQETVAYSTPREASGGSASIGEDKTMPFMVAKTAQDQAGEGQSGAATTPDSATQETVAMPSHLSTRPPEEFSTTPIKEAEKPVVEVQERPRAQVVDTREEKKPGPLIWAGAAVALVVVGLIIYLLLPSGPQGVTLVVRGAPPGSKVFVNDAEKGAVAADGTARLTALAPGEMTVRVAREGYADFSATVSGNDKEEKALAATLLPLTLDLNGQMALIPAGEFVMGSNDSKDNEKPAHTLTLPAYYIDKYEVTNAQYKRFCDETGRKPPENQEWDPTYFESQPDSPVVGVTRDVAAQYAKWAGKRLPTEAEWEKAASWDPAARKKRLWPWGDNADPTLANLVSKKPAPVTQFSGDRSYYGVFGMAGNVYEWVDSYYDAYPGSTYKAKEYGKTNSAVRGGVFPLRLEEARTSYRNFLPATFDGPMLTPVGFRCAVSADAPEVKSRLAGGQK